MNNGLLGEPASAGLMATAANVEPSSHVGPLKRLEQNSRRRGGDEPPLIALMSSSAGNSAFVKQVVWALWCFLFSGPGGREGGSLTVDLNLFQLEGGRRPQAPSSI